MHLAGKIALAISGLASTVLSNDIDAPIQERAAASSTQYTTTTEKVIATITTSSAITINTGISETGVKVLIPGALTLTFSDVPAYIYLETEAIGTSLSTGYTTKTIKVTSTAKAASSTKASGSSAASSKPSSSSTQSSASAVSTKSISGCAEQGTPNADMESERLGWSISDSVLQCQSYCQGMTTCISYGWEPTTRNCTNFHAWIDVKAGNTGVYYSNKYPSDSSNFCYS